MDLKKEKLVRFHANGKQTNDFVWGRNDALHLEKSSSGYKVSSSLLKSDFGLPVRGKLNDNPKFGTNKVFPEDHRQSQKRILDPGSEIVLQWNRVFIVSCLLALFIDPLYFYLPSVGGNKDSWCVKTDLNLRIIVTAFRTLADLFYMLHVAIKFRTAYVAPSSRVFGRGELVMDPEKIARRYLRTDFFIDLIATLPLPQIVIWFIIPAMRNSGANHNNNALALIVLLQYIPRLYLIFPLSSELVKATGVVTKTAWAGAAYNLMLYILASHVMGAAWYLLSIDRHMSCWKSICKKESACSLSYIDCNTVNLSDRVSWAKTTNAFSQCSADDKLSFKYGIFENAITKNVVSSSFFHKYFYCLWWGLQQLRYAFSQFGVLPSKGRSVMYSGGCLRGELRDAESMGPGVVYAGVTDYPQKDLWIHYPSTPRMEVKTVFFVISYGQNLSTSTFIGETSFAILIAIVGLVLFAHLIGNMQTYLQSLTMRLEEWRLRRRDTEEWMRHRQLPEDLRRRVRRFVQYKWVATRGVDEEAILHGLPADLRRDIQRHLCLDLVRRVPFFSQMDDQLLDAICERLVSSLSTQGTYIVREGDPVTEMFFIIRGRLESSTTNGGRTGFFNSITMRPGDFCGEELLAWALHPKSAGNLPSSTRTVRSVTEVEAFALRAEDLKFVANQFRRLHSKKLQHTFRHYSHHWRTWAACFIQAAWRRHKRRMLAKDLSTMESFVEHTEHEQDEQEQEESLNSPSKVLSNLGVTILASRFAANTRRGAAQRIKSSGGLPKLQKPEEPDFSAEPDIN